MQPAILLNSCAGLNPSNPNGNIRERGRFRIPCLRRVFTSSGVTRLLNSILWILGESKNQSNCFWAKTFNTETLYLRFSEIRFFVLICWVLCWINLWNFWVDIYIFIWNFKTLVLFSLWNAKLNRFIQVYVSKLNVIKWKYTNRVGKKQKINQLEIRYLDQMMVIRRLAGVAPEGNLRNPLHTSEEVCK